MGLLGYKEVTRRLLGGYYEVIYIFFFSRSSNEFTLLLVSLNIIFLFIRRGHDNIPYGLSDFFFFSRYAFGIQRVESV